MSEAIKVTIVAPRGTSPAQVRAVCGQHKWTSDYLPVLDASDNARRTAIQLVQTMVTRGVCSPGDWVGGTVGDAFYFVQTDPHGLRNYECFSVEK